MQALKVDVKNVKRLMLRRGVLVKVEEYMRICDAKLIN